MLKGREGRVWAWITGKIKALNTEGTKDGNRLWGERRRKTLLENFVFESCDDIQIEVTSRQ